MKVLDYVQYLSDVIPQDALIVASHTDNSVALALTKLTDRALLGFNMGFATPVGLGLALALPHRRVIILDGDGGVLLMPSSISDLGSQNPRNVIVIVADNESSLAFPSHSARRTDIEGLAKAAGIEHTATVRSLDEFKSVYDQASKTDGLTYIVAKTQKFRAKVPRGSETPFLWENKYHFVRHIEQTEDIQIIRPFGG